MSFFEKQKAQGDISEFCSTRCIEWRFIPERAPHFGGLWEAAVKSMKFHFKRIVGNTKLTFEELTTILTQIESCLNRGDTEGGAGGAIAPALLRKVGTAPPLFQNEYGKWLSTTCADPEINTWMMDCQAVQSSNDVNKIVSRVRSLLY